MENNILKSLLKEYEKKKYYKELEFEGKKQEFSLISKLKDLKLSVVRVLYGGWCKEILSSFQIRVRAL